jgi:hypothetical protein
MVVCFSAFFTQFYEIDSYINEVVLLVQLLGDSSVVTFVSDFICKLCLLRLNLS